MKNIKLLALALFSVFLFQQSNGQSCKAALGFYNSSPFYVGDTMSFKNNSQYNAASRPNFYWTFGDGSSSTQFEPLHIYSNPGAYAVCLTIFDSVNNCTSGYCDSILVTGTSSPKCEAKYGFSIGSGSSSKTVSFSNNSTYSGSSATYKWTFGDGNSSTATAPTHTYASYGKYSVTLEITSGTCTDKLTKTVNVQGASACNAAFTMSTSGAGCTFSFTNKSTSGTSAYWTFGDGSSSTTWSPTHQYAKDGWYAITLTISDSSRTCTDKYTDSVYARSCDTTTSKCNVSFVYSRDSSDTCKTAFFAKSTGSAMLSNVSWSFGDGNYGWGASASHKYASAGWYAVTISLTDSANNCSATYTDSIYAYVCGSSTKCKLAIAGQVYADNNFASAGIVYLIQENSGVLTAVDTTYIDSMGGYYFGGVCAGAYYVKAALDKSDMNYTDYLPTYYGNELRWDSVKATTISINKYGVDINLIKGYNAGGKGFIGGDVRKGANKRAGEPIENIEVIILNEDLKPSSYTYSQEDGTFDLSNLSLGKYFLFVDIPGVKSLGTWIELTEDQPEVKDIQIKVEDDQIATNVKFIDLNTTWGVYPNPADDQLFLQTGNNKGAYIEIVDMLGKNILWTNVFNGQTIDISSIPSGTYIIRGFEHETMNVLSKKIVVKN